MDKHNIQHSVCLIWVLIKYNSRLFNQITSQGIRTINSLENISFFLFVSSSFTSNVNLTANSSSLTISKAILSAKQIDSISVVSINETFNISVVLIDSQTRLQISNLQWRNVTWLANVSLFTLPEYNSNGKLIKLNTSTIRIETQLGKIIATDLAIDQIGMYVIKVQLKSTNDEYEFSLKSSAILVKQSSSRMMRKRERFFLLFYCFF